VIRPARVFAVARRDLKVVLAGKGSWRLGLTALALLLPAGAMPLPEFKTPLGDRPGRRETSRRAWPTAFSTTHASG
jgi:hypothetical protein